jgi:PPOX class probable F420-dependent enzyme
MANLSEVAQELLAGPNFAHLGTINRDGSPQVTPIWIDLEDGRPVLNTVVGRVKHRNILRDPRVTLEIGPADDPYRYVELRGRATELTEDGAVGHIDKLAQKYTGNPFRPLEPGEIRVKVYVDVERELQHL